MHLRLTAILILVVSLVSVSSYGIATAVGVDGTVYVVSMGATSFNPNDPVDSIMIFRSKKPPSGDSGATFEPAVRIPGLPVAAIDKPVVAVHPGKRRHSDDYLLGD